MRRVTLIFIVLVNLSYSQSNFELGKDETVLNSHDKCLLASNESEYETVSSLDNIYPNMNSNSMNDYIDGGLNEQMVRGGQYSKSRLDKMLREKQKEDQEELLIYVVVGILLVIVTIVFYNQFLRPEELKKD
jgi:hypothetical protein